MEVAGNHPDCANFIFIMDVKKEAARVASTLVVENTLVGLGDGSTVRLLADFLIDRMNAGLEIRLYTSSQLTLEFLQRRDVFVNDISHTGVLDIYFDGCDQIDGRLNALKSGSGIHTMEKLLASMAKKFVIIGDDSKFVQKLDPTFPLVLEVLPLAITFVQRILLSIRSGMYHFHTQITGSGKQTCFNKKRKFSAGLPVSGMARPGDNSNTKQKNYRGC